MLGAEVERARVDKFLAPAIELEVHPRRVGTLAVLVVADHSVHGLSMDLRAAEVLVSWSMR